MFESANIPQQPLGFSPANQVSNIRVEKLLMFETGTYYPQHRRPYVADTGVANVVALQEKVAESGRSVAPGSSSFIRQLSRSQWRRFRADGISVGSVS
jgi:hypothetical protein